MRGHVALPGANDRLDRGGIDAVDNIMLGEQKSGGYNDGAKLMQRKDSKPELIVAFEHHHDHIALADALGAQHVGGFVTVAFQVAVGENMLLPADCTKSSPGGPAQLRRSRPPRRRQN